MTPIYKINLDGSNVWAKLENQNPTGTHKDRSMERWIAYYVKEGARELAISSSGNSAISAAKYCQESNIILHVFVSPKIHSEKRRLIEEYKNISLHNTKTPNKDSFRLCRERGIPNLRASKDDMALEGYAAIALELTEQLPHIDNLFIPTSSGATLEGMFRGFVSHTPSFYAVQTAAVHPIANYFDKEFSDQETSQATAIVDRIAHRRDRVIEIIERTRGGGFVIENKELEEAKKITEGMGLPAGETGWQSALAFAGFLKWQERDIKKSKQQISVCLFTD